MAGKFCNKQYFWKSHIAVISSLVEKSVQENQIFINFIDQALQRTKKATKNKALTTVFGPNIHCFSDLYSKVNQYIIVTGPLNQHFYHFLIYVFVLYEKEAANELTTLPISPQSESGESTGAGVLLGFVCVITEKPMT